MERSLKVARPPTPPPPEEPEAGWATPHENESTSISSLCVASVDSPLMSPILAKMPDAIWALLRGYGPERQGPAHWAECNAASEGRAMGGVMASEPWVRGCRGPSRVR